MVPGLFFVCFARPAGNFSELLFFFMWIWYFLSEL